MNKKPETLLTSLRSEGLYPSEKLAMRERVQASMATQPVRSRPLLRHLWYGISSPGLALNLSKPMIIALIVAVAVALGGGVSYAAEQSLPGEALYIVKTSVNEPVREVLALSAEAKSEWEARRVERRLEEAETLAAEGRLSEEIRVAIEQHLQERIEDLKERIGKFQEKQDLSGAAEASARLEIALSVHNQILEQLTLKVDGQTKALHEKVKKEHQESEDLDEALNKEEDDEDDNKGEDYKKEAAEGKREAASHKLEEVKNFVAKAKVSAETRAAAEAKLAAVAELLAKGDASLQAKNFEEAFDLYRDAHRAAQEVKAFVSAEHATAIKIKLKAQEEKRGDDDQDDEKDEVRAESGREDDDEREDDEKREDIREDEAKDDDREDEDGDDDEEESLDLRLKVNLDAKDED